SSSIPDASPAKVTAFGHHARLQGADAAARRVAPNLWFLASGVLVLGLAVFHSLLGELYLVRRLLRRTDLPHLFGDDSFTRLTIRYAWHLLTIVCTALTIVLFVLAVRTPDATTTVIARIIGVALI